MQSFSHKVFMMHDERYTFVIFVALTCMDIASNKVFTIMFANLLCNNSFFVQKR